MKLKQTCNDIIATMESLVAGVFSLKEETIAIKKTKIDEKVFLGNNEVLNEKKHEYE